MSDEFSRIPKVSPDKGRAQWVWAEHEKTEEVEGKNLTLYHMLVRPLMPCTTIFVHGVNSEGEWFDEAARQFAAGLNRRLGRDCLEELRFDPNNRSRFLRRKGGGRFRSPIIPFYWGYKMHGDDLTKYPGLYHDRQDMSWGGGPFQNGTNNLLQFWQGGFKEKVHGISLQNINTSIDRLLGNAPPRAYFIHAAKRLANLIDTIREDFPDEPVNVVAHSQGNMITLCAMLYVKNRAPDTLLLNNAPYSFDTQFTDSFTAEHGSQDVQTEEARIATFRFITEKIAKAANFTKSEKSVDDCTLPGIKDFTVVHVHMPPEQTNWHSQIGTGKVNDQGQQWQDSPMCNRDNRGKVFVNFNPHDRVIGVAAIAGIGWRGIPEALLYGNAKEAYHPKVPSPFSNVYQRIFVRNSGSQGIPAIGEKTHYWFHYFKEKEVPDTPTLSEGNSTSPPEYLTFDGKPAKQFWIPKPDSVLLGLANVQATPNVWDKVWINAPEVPEPVKLDDLFDSGTIQFNGLESGYENEGQQEDYAIFRQNYVAQRVADRTLGHRGETYYRLETPTEIKARLDAYGTQRVPLTDHSQFLTYRGTKGHEAPIVQKVLSYDLTVGQGYAYGDVKYWDYLLDLADWKISDPYYITGELPPPGPYPEGLDPRTKSTGVVPPAPEGA